MAELFSKEYLKELLASDSLADAAATTAQAGFESAVKKAAEDGTGGQLGSVASQILEGTSGEAVATAAGQAFSGNRSDALQTLAGGIDQEALRNAADDALDKVSERAAEKSGGLFSQDYLQNLLDSDALVDSVSRHIDGIVEENPAIAESIAEQQISYESASLPQGGQAVQDVLPPHPVQAKVSVQQYPPPAQTSYSVPPAAPARSVSEGQSEKKPPSKFTFKKFLLYGGLALLLFFVVIPSCSRCAAGTADTGTSFSSGGISFPTSTSTYDFHMVENVVARGFVTDTEGTVEYFDVSDEEALAQAQPGGIEPLLGYPCVVVEDEDGYIVTVCNDIIFQGDYGNSVTYAGNGEKAVDYAALRKDEVLLWYPEAHDVTGATDNLSMVLAVEQTADPRDMYGVDTEDHPDGLCHHAIAVLGGTQTGGFFYLYCGCEGRVEYGTGHTSGYDFSTRVLYLPQYFDPARKAEV